VNIREHVDLAPYTTFGVSANCERLITVTSVEELQGALREHPAARILGGGSNVLVTRDIDVPVIRIAITGIDQQDGAVRVGAGEQWHGFVQWCVEHDLGGLENLALIPGTVGAAPMQNIGAYGVEQERCFVALEAVDRLTGNLMTFTKDDCLFGYRTSIFKTAMRDRAVITSVVYRLSHPPHHLVTSYKDVAEELSHHHAPLTIRDVFDAVVAIRTRKLPDPREIGNGGSFFKNPVLSAEDYASLIAQHGEVPHYPQDDGSVKVPAAWLIDQCGWKGKRVGHAGVHDRQALVLVNHGGATGSEVLTLALQIKDSVHARFGIELEAEVNLW